MHAIIRLRWFGLSINLGAWSILPVATAWACSCATPDLGFLAGSQIEIPSNARGLMWAGVVDEGGAIVLPPAETFRIQKWVDSAWVSCEPGLSLIRYPRATDTSGNRSPYDVLLVAPADGITPGDRLRFVYYPSPERSLDASFVRTYSDSQVVDVAVAYEAFEPSPMKKTASNVEHGKLRLATGVGSCHVELDASWVDVADVLDPSFEKWQDSFYFATVVVDAGRRRLWQPHSSLCDLLPPGRPWTGIGSERFYETETQDAFPVYEQGIDLEACWAFIDIWLPGSGTSQLVQIDFTSVRE